MIMTVTAAVKRDLRAIRKAAPEVANSALAASALALAAEIDGENNSATSKSMCARALSDLMGQLRDLMPEEEKRDSIDDLASRRARRVAGGSAA